MADEWDARDAGRSLHADVTRAITDERAKAAGEGRHLTDAAIARAVLRSPALADANRKLLDDLMTEYQPKVTALAADALALLIKAAVTAERERIRQVAIRNHAVCTGDDGTSCYFAALIGEPSDA